VIAVESAEVMIPPLANVTLFDAYDTPAAVRDILFPVTDLSLHSVTDVVPVTVDASAASNHN
jgi:hypothetical protein